MRGSRRFCILACQMSRAGFGQARSVGDLEKGLAIHALKVVVAEAYRGLHTGTQALLTMHKLVKPVLFRALATGARDEYNACAAGLKVQPNTLQIRRFA